MEPRSNGFRHEVRYARGAADVRERRADRIARGFNWTWLQSGAIDQRTLA